MITLEILATSADGVRAAVDGGASRIELCQSLAEGGTTPSVGLISIACRIARADEIPVMVMIRPRGGDFTYDDDEVGVMRTDIAVARESGAAGIVLGCLDGSGRVDQELTSLLVADAGDLDVTFHRAVDVAVDPVRAAADAFASGCTRVLSSGGAATAWEGRRTISRMVTAAPDDRHVIAAGGIVPANVVRVVAATGVLEVHASVRTAAPGRSNLRMSLGPQPDWPDGSWPVPDTHRVRQLRSALGN